VVQGPEKAHIAKEVRHVRHHQWWSSQALFTARIQRKIYCIYLSSWVFLKFGTSIY